MKEEIKSNTNGMKEEMKKMRGEMQKMGHGLQAGIMALAYDETRTAREKMAAPRAGTGELKGSAPAGEDRVIRETCWARRVKVTETVIQGGKLIGVTETCTSETGREVTELTGTREIEKKLHGTDGVKDVHTHTHTGSGGRWGRAGTTCWDPVRAAG